MQPINQNTQTISQTSTNQQISYTTPDKKVDADANVNTVVTTKLTEFSAGPIPHPKLIKEYDTIITNGAERIMQMAEKEQANRFKNDETNRNIQRDEIKLIRRGQIFAFILCIIFVLAGITMAVFGYGAISYVLIGFGMAPVIGLFYNASHSSK